MIGSAVPGRDRRQRKNRRLPANQVLQSRIGYLLTRPVGRPPHHVRRFHANFSYQAGTWTKPRRVIAKVEWHPGELYPRVGFIVTKHLKTDSSVSAANAVRLQLHALAMSLASCGAMANGVKFGREHPSEDGAHVGRQGGHDRLAKPFTSSS